jgi:hypothetical protein
MFKVRLTLALHTQELGGGQSRRSAVVETLAFKPPRMRPGGSYRWDIATIRAQVHLGDTPHSLTKEDFQDLARNTPGFSGSDVGVMVKDVLFEPVHPRCSLRT